jgi:diguanylate cyclase (GGDEF)-like protein/PAS domain S-box-containing protein
MSVCAPECTDKSSGPAWRSIIDMNKKHASSDVLDRCFESNANALALISQDAPDYPIIRVNAAFEHLFGCHGNEIIGRPSVAVFGMDGLAPEILANLRNPAETNLKGFCSRLTDASFMCRLQMQPISDEQGRVTHTLCIVRDATSQVENESNRDYLATHDSVTGLVRARIMKENLSSELTRAVHHCFRLIVCYLDVDKFGVINETYGFNFGDLLIRQIADRLKEKVDRPDLMCRIAGDELVITFVDLQSDMDQFEVAQQLLDVLAEPIHLGLLSLNLTASIGVACFPDSATSVEELLQQAAVSARVAKRNDGGDGIRVFSQEQRDELDKRTKVGARLRGAVQRGELELHYQPVIGAQKREITGMEALVRWRSPELGLVMPEHFISLAEDFGMIAEIGQWVLINPCQQARTWLDHGVGELTLSRCVAPSCLKTSIAHSTHRASRPGCWNLS